ncbi:ABC transporter permease [Brytella acorum]|uniref:ABC transporter permease n=1 Tax=Brytella acorum TaxID=2959299 RepID=A0AA35XWL3_9PROT|nr:ABC transporter permease [Brytella acorum]MDF3625232.1 ABC transporter permease [Brytella acorum]CAI9119356.1 ABC transporter permease [Brytella acorum]
MRDGPWSRVWHGLGQRRGAMAALGLLGLIVAASLAAPFYAAWVGVDPFVSNVAGTTLRHGQVVDLMQPNDNPLHLGLTPLGPDWRIGEAYGLGSDAQGRDVAARVLYGGRNSLLISAAAAILCMMTATAIGLCAGYFGGWVDIVLSRMLDVLWAIPVYLLAISLSIVTVGHGLRLGPVTIGADNLLIPVIIIALVYIPYAARPLRARALSLSRAEFVMVSRGLGASHWRILTREILPNLADTLVVLAPLLMALCLLAESSLSFLSLGVQAPAASWGTIIQDGEGLLYTRPAVAILPGLMIVATVLSLNVLGDALRDTLDPKRRGRS